MLAICQSGVSTDQQAPNTSSQVEKDVSKGKNPRAKSGLRSKQSSKHPSESKNEASKSQTAPTPVVNEMHKESQQAADGSTSLGATSEEGAHPQLSSGTNPSVLIDKTKSARDGLNAVQTDTSINEGSSSHNIKLEDLAHVMYDTRSAFFSEDFLEEPIIVTNESEEEEPERHEDTQSDSHD
ncbi:hypothetical protein Tco_0946928 [Tanacetum coccineum]